MTSLGDVRRATLGAWLLLRAQEPAVTARRVALLPAYSRFGDAALNVAVTDLLVLLASRKVEMVRGTGELAWCAV